MCKMIGRWEGDAGCANPIVTCIPSVPMCHCRAPTATKRQIGIRQTRTGHLPSCDAAA